MNLVKKETSLKICKEFSCSSTSIRQQLNTNPVISTKPLKHSKNIVNSKPCNRIFGKELQNHSLGKSMKGSKTPSTQNSVCASVSKSQKVIENRKNPQLVECYRSRINRFLAERDIEQKVESKFLTRQQDVNRKMRGILVDWLVDVSAKFKLLPETFFCSVHLLDRFLERKQVKRTRLQLVGITCLMIMSKFEEIYPPSVRDYVCVCDRAYTQEQLLDTEAEILHALQFDLAITSSLTFYQEILTNVHLSPKPSVFGEYLLQTALLSEKAFKFSNRELACGAVFLVNKIFKCKKKFSKDLGKFMIDISESRVKSCAKELYKILTVTSQLGLTAIKRKFATIEKFEVSKYKIERASKGKSKNPKKSK